SPWPDRAAASAAAWARRAGPSTSGCAAGTAGRPAPARARGAPRRSAPAARESSPSRLLLREPRRELRPDGQLGRGQAHGLALVSLADGLHLEYHSPGPHEAHPLLWRALALAHARLLGLLRDRLVREDAHPDLAAALDEPRHRHARRL